MSRRAQELAYSLTRREITELFEQWGERPYYRELLIELLSEAALLNRLDVRSQSILDFHQRHNPFQLALTPHRHEQVAYLSAGTSGSSFRRVQLCRDPNSLFLPRFQGYELISDPSFEEQCTRPLNIPDEHISAVLLRGVGAVVGRESCAALLPSLSMLRMEGADLELWHLTTQFAFDVVMRLVKGGLAYGNDFSSPEARQVMWGTIGALAGASAEETPDGIVDAVAKATWFGFDGSLWHEKLLWQFGLICFREGGREIALLAAKDED